MFTKLPTYAALVGVLLSFAVALPGQAKKPAGDKVLTYREHLKPVLRRNCLMCHNSDDDSAGLDMSTYPALMEGSSAGPIVLKGKPKDSMLYLVVTHEEVPSMPPNSEKIEAEDIAVIKKWIEQGALDRAPSKATKVVKATAGKATGKTAAKLSRATALTAMAVSAQGMVAASGQAEVQLFANGSLQSPRRLALPEGEAYSLSFSRDGRRLVVGCGKPALSGTVVMFDTATGKRLGNFGDELDTVRACDVSPNGKLLAYGGPSRMVKVMTLKGDQQQGKARKLSRHTHWITRVQFDPTGLLLATADREGGLFVWDTLQFEVAHTLRAQKDCISDLAWAPDGEMLVSASEDGTMATWDMHTGELKVRWMAHKGGVTSCALVTDRKQIVTVGRDGRVAIWSLAGKLVAREKLSCDLPLFLRRAGASDALVLGDANGSCQVLQGNGKVVASATVNRADAKLVAAAAAQVSQPATIVKATQSQATAAPATANLQAKLTELQGLTEQLARLASGEHNGSLLAAELQAAKADRELAETTTQLQNAVKVTEHIQAALQAATGTSLRETLRSALQQAQTRHSTLQGEASQRRQAKQLADTALATQRQALRDLQARIRQMAAR